MKKIFGSGGLEGTAFTELTPSLALDTGRAIAYLLSRKSGLGVKVIVGKDTRLSSDIIEAALCAGLMSCGVDVVSLGVMPAPAVSTYKALSGAGGDHDIKPPG